MRIDLSAAPPRVDDLLRFLRQSGYVAREVEHAVIEVDDAAIPKDHFGVAAAIPEDHFGVAAALLSLRVRVWSSVNDTHARVVQMSESLERDAS